MQLHVLRKNSGGFVIRRFKASAAFILDIGKYVVDRLVVRSTDHLSPALLLIDQSGLSESGEMMRKRRRRYAEMLLQRADIDAFTAGPHQKLEDTKPSAIAERCKRISSPLLHKGFSIAHNKTITLVPCKSRSPLEALSARRRTQRGLQTLYPGDLKVGRHSSGRIGDLSDRFTNQALLIGKHRPSPCVIRFGLRDPFDRLLDLTDVNVGGWKLKQSLCFSALWRRPGRSP